MSIRAKSSSDSRHSPSRKVVILVREASRATFSLNTSESGVRLFHIDNVLVVCSFTCTIDDSSGLEDTGTNGLTALNSETFPESSNVVSTRAENGLVLAFKENGEV